MMRSTRTIGWLVAVMLITAVVVGTAAAQTQPPPDRPGRQGAVRLGQGGGGRAGGGQPATPGEVQALFDAMVIVQAQRALALTDAQYPQFVGRLKALQDTRRRLQRERNQLIQEISKMTAPDNATIDETQVRARLKALEDLQARAATELKKGYDGVDQVLDLRQQARFRVFEEQIERRKFDFLLNARRRAGTEPGL